VGVILELAKGASTIKDKQQGEAMNVVNGLCPHYYEKLIGIKLICKLLENRMLEMSKIKNDHKIILRLSGYGGQARK